MDIKSFVGGDHPFEESALFHVPHDGFANSMDVYLFVQIWSICWNPDNSNASNPSSFRHVWFHSQKTSSQTLGRMLWILTSQTLHWFWHFEVVSIYSFALLIGSKITRNQWLWDQPGVFPWYQQISTRYINQYKPIIQISSSTAAMARLRCFGLWQLWAGLLKPWVNAMGGWGGRRFFGSCLGLESRTPKEKGKKNQNWFSNRIRTYKITSCLGDPNCFTCCTCCCTCCTCSG
jgi:hypothetical protein